MVSGTCVDTERGCLPGPPAEPAVSRCAASGQPPDGSCLLGGATGVSARGLHGDLDVAEELDPGTLMASPIIGMSNRTYPSRTPGSESVWGLPAHDPLGQRAAGQIERHRMGRQEVAQHRVRVTRIVAAWDLRPAIRAGPAMASRAGWLGVGEEGAGGSVAQHHARFLSVACAAHFVRGGVTIGRSVPRRLVVTPGLEPGPSRLYGGRFHRLSWRSGLRKAELEAFLA
jgi:hypothetical protein